ncbi:MAG: acetoacetate decarboxylase family protein [Anaerolineales bacterium]|nr:acetoacetate decarboxylase family protein [Anaerolineales bacterium]
MPYQFLPNRMYRMPTHFGPSSGPREAPDGSRYENINTPRVTTIRVNYLTNRQQLEDLLPPDFDLNVGEEPVVSVTAAYSKEIEWLAGRGYNKLGVSFPVIYNAQQDRVRGELLLVLWENLCDPILTGRDELGYPKLYCELPEPRIHNGEVHCSASWMDFKFADNSFKNGVQCSPEESLPTLNRFGGDGLLVHKYAPKTGEWCTPEISYLALTPAGGGKGRIQELYQGRGQVQFHPAAWEDMPTQFHIVNALRDLEIRETLDAWLIKRVGGRDIRDQRILPSIHNRHPD